MAGPQEALLVAELEAVQVVGLLGPSLQAREAQAHVDTGVQLLRGEPVHPGQEALAQPLHQRAVHLGYLLGKRRGQVRGQGQATAAPYQGIFQGINIPTFMATGHTPDWYKGVWLLTRGSQYPKRVAGVGQERGGRPRAEAGTRQPLCPSETGQATGGSPGTAPHPPWSSRQPCLRCRCWEQRENRSSKLWACPPHLHKLQPTWEQVTDPVFKT